ncbi:MAG: hypothetical protein AAFV53_02780 [Myxococcota bacterium]
MMHGRRRLFTMLVLIAGCDQDVDSAAVDVPTSLPPQDTAGVDLLGDTGWVFGDTGDFGGPTDEVPDNTLEMVHEAWLDARPIGGPYNAISGTLTIVEYLDGNMAVPWCYVEYSMVGDLVEDELEQCTDCDYTFSVLFTVTAEGDPSPDPETEEPNPDIGGLAGCASPELPEDDEIRTFGFSEIEQTFYFNYYGAGIWVPWYDAQLLNDELYLLWTETTGFTGVEDAEDQ